MLLFTGPSAKRNLPLSEMRHSLSELNQYPIIVFQREMAERREDQITSYIMVKGMQGHDSTLLCKEGKFGWNQMDMRTEDSLENQEKKWSDEGKIHAT